MDLGIPGNLSGIIGRAQGTRIRLDDLLLDPLIFGHPKSYLPTCCLTE